MRLAVCIPTYNEKENISGLISEIFKYAPEAHVIVADDNSPDGTAEIARQIPGNVTVLLRRSDRGFANSYKDAFAYALSRGTDLILQMDADFSHHPRFIPQMIESIKNSDFVVGSRYKKGGEVVNWPWFRKFLSKGGNTYASTFLGRSVSDMTGGFNLWRRSTLERIPVMDFVCDGYSFLIELKFRALQLGFKPAEVPIEFIDRTQAASKMSGKIMVEAVLRVPMLAFSKPPKNQTPFNLNPNTEVLDDYLFVANA